jgi:hypothetical protein
MRGINIVGAFLSRFSSFRSGWLALAVLAILANPAVSPAAEKIAVFPTVPYYIYIVYQNLAVFWVAILGLLIIIRMKLREIERIQEMGIEQEDQEAPLLQ